MRATLATTILEPQRHRLFLWVPVMFGAGIAVYFAVPYEPSVVMIVAITTFGALSIVGLRVQNILARSFLLSILLISFGYSYAAYRTVTVSAPILQWRYYGPIEGRIVNLDRSSSNAVRVTLDQVYLPEIPRKNTPERVRVSLQGFIPEGTLIPAARIALTGGLAPPGAPVEPQGFDFRRMAYFLKLGAVGYTRNPVMPAFSVDEDGFSMWVFKQRLHISRIIQENIGGENGAFAAAILTGDRSGINPEVLADLRTANLAHLLAISGLHMGLLSGFVFGLMRYGLALIPYVSLRIQVKKLAAIIAIMAGFSYLILSGANVATQRAFIMTFVVLMAVLLDRPAFTLRAVALAAMIVLAISPNSLLGAGFQMSFAATTALIAVYDWLRGSKIWFAAGHVKFLKPILGVILTSTVAGLATAPFSAFHFNQLSQYGLLANVMAVPVMGAMVMPSAVIALLLLPFGLHGVALEIMGHGVGWILGVSAYFANIEGAAILVKSGPPFVLGLLSFGGVLLLLWQGRGKIVGLGIMLVAISIWSNTPRPAVFLSEDGRVFGVMSNQGRVISRKRGYGYGVGIWLENDGDGITQTGAHARSGLNIEGKVTRYILPNMWEIVTYLDDETPPECSGKTILITPKLNEQYGECLSIHHKYLRNSGALTITFEGDIPIIQTSREFAKTRPWGY